MLKVENLDLYYGASQALYKINIEARPGEVTCVLGRNGVGKTSLLRALAGQKSCKADTMIWNEQSIARLGPYDRARHGIAYVPQGREIFSQLTVFENLKTGFAAIPRNLRIIPQEIYTLFPVLKDMLGRRGGDLSGGQQQQLAIARALVTRPKLLMLDEPTEGIQPSIIKDIQNVIARLRDQGEMAIILVEQYLDFAYELADKFTVMDRGSIVLAGPREFIEKTKLQGLMTV